MPKPRKSRRTWLLAILAASVALAIAAVVWWQLRDVNPLAGRSLYVIPDTQAAERSRDPGLPPEAAESLEWLASQPSAEWFTDGTPAEVERRARHLATNAAAEGKALVAVVYNIPERDCGQHSAGGTSNDEYRAWILALIRGLTMPDYPEFQAVLIYEPDAVAHTIGDEACLSREAAGERLALMSETVAKLKTRPGLLVYVDAGHSAWFSDPDDIAPALEEAGVDRADGFAINVSNFQTTEDSLRYGRKLSDELGGKHFVVDTSRNGAGPNTTTEPVWCNPPGIKPGPPPTTDTGGRRVDAFLWVKHLGESDGDCRPGEPPAGHWMQDYALAALRDR